MQGRGKNNVFMKGTLLTLLLILSCSATVIGQVGIGTTSPDASSALDIESADKGVLISRMTTAERNAITNPANGLLVYNTDSDEIQINSNNPATPIWRALSLAATGSSPGESFKYSNTDIATNVNQTPAITLPVFGAMDWNDNITLYDVTGNTVTIAETGRYEVIINVSLLNVSGERNAPEIRITLDGAEVGTYGSTGYNRNLNGHIESSLHIREILEVNANQVLAINIAQGANTSEVRLRSAGTSNIYVEKKM